MMNMAANQCDERKFSHHFLDFTCCAGFYGQHNFNKFHSKYIVVHKRILLYFNLWIICNNSIFFTCKRTITCRFWNWHFYPSKCNTHSIKNINLAEWSLWSVLFFSACTMISVECTGTCTTAGTLRPVRPWSWWNYVWKYVYSLFEIFHSCAHSHRSRIMTKAYLAVTNW